jgi:hypothetical protein
MIKPTKQEEVLTSNRRSELYKFIESLHDRGLLSKPPSEFDYEKVIWEYVNNKVRKLKSYQEL